MDAVQRLQHANEELVHELQRLDETFNEHVDGHVYNNATPELRKRFNDIYISTSEKAKRRIEINTRMIKQFQRGSESYVDGSTNVTNDATADATR